MFDVKTIKPGQRITVKYFSPVTWARKTNNPFVCHTVEKSSTVSFSACGNETYANQMAKHGQELSGKPSWHRPADEIAPCAHIHKERGTVYLAGVNHNTVESQYYIDGRLATDEEKMAIKEWIKTSNQERGIDFRLWTIEKLENAILE